MVIKKQRNEVYALVYIKFLFKQKLFLLLNYKSITSKIVKKIIWINVS
jgi:hypothetical protein